VGHIKEKNNMSSKSLVLTLGAVVLATTACSSNTGKVSVSAKSAALTSSTPGSLDVGNGIVIDRVRVVILKVKLEGERAGAPDAGTHGGADDAAGHHLVASSSGGSDDGADAGRGDDAGRGGDDGRGSDAGRGGNAGRGGDDDADEVRVGPFLVDLAGDALAGGGLNHILDGIVPAGTYRELKVVVGVASPAQAGSDVALADMNGHSVIVDGKVDGKSFTFESSLHAELELETTLTVGAGGNAANLTLSVDPSAWLKAADGTLLDPTAAASKAQIEANIKASLDAFDDDDRDGHDDHGGHDDGSGHL
jgi:hypothetical protein